MKVNTHKAEEYVLVPRLSGQILRSMHLRFWVPAARVSGCNVKSVQVLTEDVEGSIDNATLFTSFHRCKGVRCSGVSLLSRTAGAKTVPSCLNMVSNPIVDGCIIFLGVLEVLMNLLGIVPVTRPRNIVNTIVGIMDQQDLLVPSAWHALGSGCRDNSKRSTHPYEFQ